jgi:hypothetical protein
MARATAREGMALFRVADDLYLQRRYRVSPAVTPSHVVLSP